MSQIAAIGISFRDVPSAVRARADGNAGFDRRARDHSVARRKAATSSARSLG